MSNRSYHKLRLERDQLKVRVEVLEQKNLKGFFSNDQQTIKMPIKLPKSFEILLQQKRFASMEILLENIISDTIGSEFTVISFVLADGTTESVDISQLHWDHILKLGNGDAERGIDILVKKYREMKSRKNMMLFMQVKDVHLVTNMLKAITSLM